MINYNAKQKDYVHSRPVASFYAHSEVDKVLSVGSTDISNLNYSY